MHQVPGRSDHPELAVVHAEAGQVDRERGVGAATERAGDAKQRGSGSHGTAAALSTGVAGRQHSGSKVTTELYQDDVDAVRVFGGCTFYFSRRQHRVPCKSRSVQTSGQDFS